MKRIGTLILLTAFLAQGFSQELTAGENGEKNTASDTSLNARVSIGNNLLVVEEDNDQTNLRIGNRGLTILESLEGSRPKFDFRDFRSSGVPHSDEEKDENHGRKRSRFKGHWAGIEIGFNNYLNSHNELSVPADIDYMSLHSAKSRAVNLNFAQLSIGVTRHIGFVTGLGIGWNNYRFDNNNNIQKDVNGNIEELVPNGILKKSKLSTFYMKVPLLLEFQIPTGHNRLNIAAGGIGAVKLGSSSVMVFEDNDKVKSDGDFNLNLLRYGATARMGYENFHLFATYYFTPLFEKSKGPGGYDLYPFEVGIAFTIDN